MSLPQWMQQLAQQWLPRTGKRTCGGYAIRTRQRVHPHLEELEDRLTPSGDVLAFTTAAQTFDSDRLSPPITVQLQDGSGKAITATSNVTVNLSSTSSGGEFFDTTGHALSNSRLIIPKGVSSASFTYEDNQVGTPTLQAKAPTLNLGTSQQEAVDVWLENTTTGQKIAPGQASQPIRVQLFSQYPNLFTATNSVTVQLTSSSPTGEFLDASGKVLPNGRLIIPSGSSAASFEYKDSQAGLPQLSETLGGSSIQTSINVGVSVVFTTVPQNLKAGQKSQPITVQMQDSHGNAIVAPSTANLSLSSNSQTGTFLDSHGNLISPYFSIPTGASSVSFAYEDSLGGKPTLGAVITSGIVLLNPFSDAVNGPSMSATQQETVTGPYKVVLGTPSQSISQNQPSSPITIQLLDSTGNVAVPKSATTVQLTSSSRSGQFLDAKGNVLANGLLTIPAGSGSASFEYKDSQAGFPTLTASVNGSTSQQQVNVGVSMAFITPAQSLKAGQTSGTITVRLQDSNGKPVIAPSMMPLYLSSNSNSGQFLDNSGNPLPYPSVAIQAGSSSFSFKYRDSMGGKPTLMANAELMNQSSLVATQQETVAGPYLLLLPQSPFPPTDQNEASQPIGIQLIDSTGSVAKATSAVTIQLTSSSHTGQFLDASGNVLPNGRLTIPAGSGSASFEYKDSQVGFPTLTATENGFKATMQVNVGVAVVFTTPAQNFKASQPSKTITVQLQDSNGKAFVAPSAVGIYMNSNSPTGQFLDKSGKPISYPGLSIAAGSSSASFTYEDSVGGKPTLTVNAMPFGGPALSASQQETIAGPYQVVFSTPQSPAAIPQNVKSQPMTVQLLDSTGNVAKTTSTVTVQLTSSSHSGQFLDAKGNVLASGRLTIPAGSSSASFEYKDSQVGFPTLTATENGFKATTHVNVGVSLVFTTPVQNFKTGQSSGTITVQLQDSHGKAVAAPSDLNITLNSSLDNVQFLGLSSPSVPASVLIPAGANSASFAITSNWGGTAALTASLPDLALSTTQKETIQGLSGLVFTTPPQTVAVGQKSQRVTLQLVDNHGNAAVAPSGGLTIYLTGNTPGLMSTSPPKFFDGNGTPLPRGTAPYFNGVALLMPAGSSTVSFQVESTQAGAMPIYAQISNGPTFNNGPSSNQVETFQAGASKSLVFETPSQALAAGVPSGSITVQVQDQYGNPITAGGGGLTFTLHSSSSGGTFLSANGDPLTNSTITLLPGLSSATFEYKDSRVGTPTLTATAKGVSGTQKESITPVAAEIHVTNTKDSGSGSLRAAINTANAHPGSTIVFDAGVRGTIDLMRALPAITANTNIVGPGANLLTLSRSALTSSDFGIFLVDGVNITVVISGLTVANGSRTGITNMGYLTLQRIVVENNHDDGATAYPSAAGLSYGAAGGIENFGTLSILNSTIANNTTTRSVNGAGIDSQLGSVLIVNSTISGNQGINSYRTGGIGISGGTALIENSTISGNSTSPRWNSSSGGIDSDGQVTLYDTIVAGNTGSASNPTDVSGAFISLGHNLFGKADQQSSGFASSDLLGSIGKPFDPKLGALANNGGPTPTMAPLTGSLALRMGSSVDAPSTDQRGDPRPHGAIDIGAFEETTL